MSNQKKLQVFVSSTYTDLQRERQAAVEAILKAGHIPAGMELFSAGNESQFETIRRWIDDSDVYMLILGGRYGSVEPTTSLSYTELEYDYALSTGKPIFAVVMSDNALEVRVKAQGTAVIEKDHQSELRFFREKVLSKTSSFFEDEKDIKLALHETMADYSRRLDFTGWVSGRDVVDTKPLLDEIGELRKERDSLQSQLNEAKKATTKPRARFSGEWDDEELREVSETLKGIEISTKAFLADKSRAPTSYTVLYLLSALRDNLITGVSNKVGADDGEKFLYYNVLPKLEIYGLATLDKVSGVQWQRYRLSPKGLALLAFLDKAKKKVQKERAKEVESAGSPKDS